MTDRLRPGPAEKVTITTAEIAKALPVMPRGNGRVSHCPKCGAVILLADQEPSFSRCRMCGKLTPVKGTELALQEMWERRSGMKSSKPDGPDRSPAPTTYRRRGG